MYQVEQHWPCRISNNTAIRGGGVYNAGVFDCKSDTLVFLNAATSGEGPDVFNEETTSGGGQFYLLAIMGAVVVIVVMNGLFFYHSKKQKPGCNLKQSLHHNGKVC
jgi:hypothetical protein